MRFVFFFSGLILVFFLAFIVSNNKRNIHLRPVISMLVVQLFVGFLLMHTTAGISVVSAISDGFTRLMGMADSGIDFVFGGLINAGEDTFFITSLLPIVFIAVLVGILNYFKILPLIIKYVGTIINKINGIGKLENYFAVSTAILGQPEVFLTITRELPYLTDRRLYTLCTSAMSAVSMALLGSYMDLLEPKYVVVAVCVNIPSALIIASIVNPYSKKDKQDIIVESDIEQTEEEKPSFFQMIGDSSMSGFKLAITVAAMLIGFLSVLELVNQMFSGIFNVSFQTMIGYVFSPIAFLIGVPWEEAVRSGSIMATKLVTNEFVAMTDFNSMSSSLSEKASTIVSVYLVSFANFGTVGIITGSIKSLNSEKGNRVAKFAMKLLYGSTLASLLSATVVGLFV